jgi:hypothetical protein
MATRGLCRTLRLRRDVHQSSGAAYPNRLHKVCQKTWRYPPRWACPVFAELVMAALRVRWLGVPGPAKAHETGASNRRGVWSKLPASSCCYILGWRRALPASGHFA